MENKSIEVFRRRREQITHSLIELQSLRTNFREARKIIGEPREMIYSYFGKQDEQFFTNLEDFFKDNRPALKMIGFLQQDLKDLKVKTFGFFEQYGYGNPLEQGRNFGRDLRWYMQLIADRFRVEEDYLVPLLKRMSEESGSSLVNIG
jgi:hypothetical protein